MQLERLNTATFSDRFRQKNQLVQLERLNTATFSDGFRQKNQLVQLERLIRIGPHAGQQKADSSLSWTCVHYTAAGGVVFILVGVELAKCALFTKYYLLEIQVFRLQINYFKA